MEDSQMNQKTDHLLGNSLNKEEKLETNMNSSESRTCSLIRAPSLPPNLSQVIEEEGEEEEEDEDGPRMGDLIRQAMPCKLERAPSLPPFRIRKEADVGLKRGPIISKLTRRSSMDPSLFLPPKLTSNSKGSSASTTSTDHHYKRSEMITTNKEAKGVPKPRNLERSMSLKGLSDKEVIGFQELGFTFDKEDLNSTVAAKLASLEIKGKPYRVVSGKGKRSPLSEASNATEGSESPPMAKLVRSKSSAEEMKAQIKFWARAVASNVQPEC